MPSIYCADVSFANLTIRLFYAIRCFAIVMLRLAYAIICLYFAIVRSNHVITCYRSVIVRFISEKFRLSYVSMPTIHTNVLPIYANVPTVDAKLRN